VGRGKQMTHLCPGCRHPIEPYHFCCPACYAQLPRKVRDALAQAFQATLFDAERAALTWWQTHPAGAR
jgi:predicted amidophosphoribosyltransferase